MASAPDPHRARRRRPRSPLPGRRSAGPRDPDRPLPPLRPGQEPRLLPGRRRRRRHRAGGAHRPLQGGPRLPPRAPGQRSGPSPSCASPARSSPPSRPRPARSTSRSTSTSRSAACGAATTRASARSRTCSITTTVADPADAVVSGERMDAMRASMARCSPGSRSTCSRLYVEGKSLPGDRRAARPPREVDRQRPPAHQAQARRASPPTPLPSSRATHPPNGAGAPDASQAGVAAQRAPAEVAARSGRRHAPHRRLPGPAVPSTATRRIVDEPDQPAQSWGALTWRRVGELARAQAAGLDALGVGQGERVAIVSHNSARLLTAFFGVSALRPHPRAGQLPPERRRGRLHRRALAARRCCSSIPSSTTTSPASTAEAPVRPRRRDRRRSCSAFDAEPEPWADPTRTRPRRSTTRAAPPRARRACSSRTATSGSTRRRSAGTPGRPTATCTCTRCRCSTATAGA